MSEPAPATPYEQFTYALNRLTLAHERDHDILIRLDAKIDGQVQAQDRRFSATEERLKKVETDLTGIGTLRDQDAGARRLAITVVGVVSSLLGGSIGAFLTHMYAH